MPTPLMIQALNPVGSVRYYGGSVCFTGANKRDYREESTVIPLWSFEYLPYNTNIIRPILSGVTETLKLAGLDELSLAFNQGATYTFSKTASTQQTVSKTRPELDNSTGYCGYWTFLPYFVSSCGFFLGGQRKAGDWANGYYLQDEPYYTCSDDPKVTFARTNTTYLDSNGNAEGVTVFVQTYCAENLESEDTGIEDSRYNDVPPPGVVVQPVAAIDIPYTKEIVPDSYQTCYRACLCGYELEGDKRQKFTAPQLQLNPYADCKCFDALPAIFFHLLNPMDKLSRGEDIQYEVPVTPTNVSLLESSQYTNISFGEETPYADFFNLTYPPYPAINLTWVSIDESDSRIIRKPFECFAEYDQSQDIFVDYLNYLANDQHEQGENPPWIPTPTASS
ncbi:hypothetical protein ACLMJK_003731 [Lecanora helva]